MSAKPGYFVVHLLLTFYELRFYCTADWTPNMTVCGHIDLPDYKLMVFEHPNISGSDFDVISHRLANASITLDEELAGKCYIGICGYPTNLTSKTVEPGCTQFSKSTHTLPKDPFGYAFEATAIYCRCKKNRPMCKNLHCSVRRHRHPRFYTSAPQICATLFEEHDCQICYSDEKILKDFKYNGNEFKSGTNAMIRAINVKPHCVLNITSFASSPNYSVSSGGQQIYIPITTLYTESGNREPIYSTRGEDFSCTCPKNPPPTLKTTTSKTTTTTTEISATTDPNGGKHTDTSTVTSTTTDPSTVTSTTTDPNGGKHTDTSTVTSTTTDPNGGKHTDTSTVTSTTTDPSTVTSTTTDPNEGKHTDTSTVTSTTTDPNGGKHTVTSTVTWTLSTVGGLILISVAAFFIVSGVYTRRRQKSRQSRQPHQRDLKNNVDFTCDKSRKIGDGRFGTVYSGILIKPNSQQIAVKTAEKLALNLFNHDPEATARELAMSVNSILNEIKIFKYVGPHPHIVTVIGSDTTNMAGDEIYLVMELCENGSLKEFLKTLKPQTQTEPQLQFCTDPNLSQYKDPNSAKISQTPPTPLSTELLLQLCKWSGHIAEGMRFLHANNVLHMDLAAKNVLVDAKLVAKITDFSLARRVNFEYIKQTKEPVPSSGALEVLISLRDNPDNPTFTKKSDVWSYGVTLWEIFTFGETPYQDVLYACQNQLQYQNTLIDLLERGQRLSRPAFATEKIQRIMQECWHPEPRSRPTFDILKTYLNDLNDERV